MPAADPSNRELRTPEAAPNASERWWAAACASVLATLVVVGALANCARAEIQVDEEGVFIVEGDIVTEARDGGVVTNDIRTTSENARVQGSVTRNVRIEGDVATRASGAHSRACTSIGSIGGCDDEGRSGRRSGNRSE